MGVYSGKPPRFLPGYLTEPPHKTAQHTDSSRRSQARLCLGFVACTLDDVSWLRVSGVVSPHVCTS